MNTTQITLAIVAIVTFMFVNSSDLSPMKSAQFFTGGLMFVTTIATAIAQSSEIRGFKVLAILRISFWFALSLLSFARAIW